MPTKSTKRRTQGAKAAGTTATLKEFDVGVVPAGKSSHARKKSATNLGRQQTTERSVSPRAAPPTGKRTRPPLEGERAAPRERRLPPTRGESRQLEQMSQTRKRASGKRGKK